LCHFGTFHILALRPVFALSHPKSNYSRTSTKCARKSNHSRTYAKTGGGVHFPLPPLLPLPLSHSPLSLTIPALTQNRGWVGILMVTYLKYAGAPTILERPASEGRALQKKEEPKSTGKNACATSHETRATSHASRLRRAEAAPTRTFNLQLSTLNRPSQARETFCEEGAYHWIEARRGVCRAEVAVKGVPCADPAFPGSSVFSAHHHWAR
jgi:hypothetical protein